MPLREELERHGDVLFRWRSYLPLFMLPVLAAALPHSAYNQELMGGGVDVAIEVLSLAVSLFGLAIRCLTVGYVPSGTSGRNTRGQRAAVVNTTGMYSIVRHPLYLGNFVILAGITIFVQVWWFALIAVLAFWLYYERIMLKEEEFLRQRFGAVYLQWADTTPAFLPKFRPWRRPDRRYSWRTMLRREYSGFFGIITVFTLLEFAQDVVVLGRREIDSFYGVLFAVGSGVYLILRVLKKRTRLLEAE